MKNISKCHLKNLFTVLSVKLSNIIFITCFSIFKMLFSIEICTFDHLEQFYLCVCIIFFLLHVSQFLRCCSVLKFVLFDNFEQFYLCVCIIFLLHVYEVLR